MKTPLEPSRVILLSLLVALLAGCYAGESPVFVTPADPTPPAAPVTAPAQQAPENDNSQAAEVSQVEPTRVTARVEATPTPARPASPLIDILTNSDLRVSTEGALPPYAVAASLQILRDERQKVSEADDQPDLVLSAEASPGCKLLLERIMVPADRFSSILEGITLQELQAVWSGEETSPSFSAIYVSDDIVPDLEALFGPASEAVKPQAGDKLAGALWADRMGIALVPFEELVPRVRALRLDGLSTVDNRLSQADWPLATRVWLSARTPRGEEAMAAIGERTVATNRDPSKLTVLVMTGVTAMARGTAAAIERAQDYGFPARLIGPELAAADLTSTSNEIPFMEGCVADNTVNNMTLCSAPEYWESLELSGIDLIGLTGNHLNDFGLEASLWTMNLYREKGIPYYGGGRNAEEASKTLIMEHNGNRLAFLGANQFGPEYAWAGPESAGSRRFDRPQLIADIKAAKSQVDLVFAELQHTEFNANGAYDVMPLPNQVEDFQLLFDAGATVVTGIQAHAPQTVELRGDGLILYGLGNLYFDQTWSWPTRTGLVARHTIYDGRLLNTELLVSVIEMDKQLRWATPEERAQVLTDIFKASGW